MLTAVTRVALANTSFREGHIKLPNAEQQAEINRIAEFIIENLERIAFFMESGIGRFGNAMMNAINGISDYARTEPEGVANGSLDGLVTRHGNNLHMLELHVKRAIDNYGELFFIAGQVFENPGGDLRRDLLASAAKVTRQVLTTTPNLESLAHKHGCGRDVNALLDKLVIVFDKAVKLNWFNDLN